MSNDNLRLRQFDGLRIIMIFIIVLSHFQVEGYPFEIFWNKYLNNPVFAVDFFFVLSGFGMMYSMLSKSGGRIPANGQF